MPRFLILIKTKESMESEFIDLSDVAAKFRFKNDLWKSITIDCKYSFYLISIQLIIFFLPSKDKLSTSWKRFLLER